ncbi:MAG: stage V sporulation protein AE [Chloroflexota bacterium]
MRTRVIVITDGDDVARETVEGVAERFGLRTVSASAGNPTPLTGDEIARLARRAEHDPVLVMVDDRGRPSKGAGESALEELLTNPQIDVLGVVAVASHTRRAHGIRVDESVTADGEITRHPVDKDGEARAGADVLIGDTVDVLNEVRAPFVVGVGDPGKMRGQDCTARHCPITARAVEEILRRAGVLPRERGRG